MRSINPIAGILSHSTRYQVKTKCYMERNMLQWTWKNEKKKKRSTTSRNAIEYYKKFRNSKTRTRTGSSDWPSNIQISNFKLLHCSWICLSSSRSNCWTFPPEKSSRWWWNSSKRQTSSKYMRRTLYSAVTSILSTASLSMAHSRGAFILFEGMIHR